LRSKNFAMPSSDGLGTLDLQEMAHAVDPALADVRGEERRNSAISTQSGWVSAPITDRTRLCPASRAQRAAALASTGPSERLDARLLHARFGRRMKIKPFAAVRAEFAPISVIGSVAVTG